jgi:hypothetical protein
MRFFNFVSCIAGNQQREIQHFLTYFLKEILMFFAEKTEEIWLD